MAPSRFDNVPRDTSPEMDRKQIELLRQMTPQRRWQLFLDLNDTMRKHAMEAIARRYPHFSEQEVRLKFVEVHYGKTLARELRTYLARRTTQA